MSRKQHTPSSEALYFARDQVPSMTPEALIEAIASQIDRAWEAAGRIKDEGSVVRDMKGSVIAHPAIKIERDAIKEYTTLILKVRDF